MTCKRKKLILVVLLITVTTVTVMIAVQLIIIIVINLNGVISAQVPALLPNSAGYQPSVRSVQVQHRLAEIRLHHRGDELQSVCLHR